MYKNLKMPGRKKTAILPLFKDVVGGDFKTPGVKYIFYSTVVAKNGKPY